MDCAVPLHSDNWYDYVYARHQGCMISYGMNQPFQSHNENNLTVKNTAKKNNVGTAILFDNSIGGTNAIMNKHSTTGTRLASPVLLRKHTSMAPQGSVSPLRFRTPTSASNCGTVRSSTSGRSSSRRRHRLPRSHSLRSHANCGSHPESSFRSNR